MGSKLIIAFARYPGAGQCKTRLIPALGSDGAARVYRAMLDRTLSWIVDVRRSHRIEAEVRYTGGSHAEMAALAPRETRLAPQGDGDLGARMERAVLAAMERGFQQVVVVGADCPRLSSSLALQAFDLLTTHDIVLGPARDGGYYLIGLKGCPSALFRDIDWGTESVLRQTIQAARSTGHSLALLPVLRDVDCPEDLPEWELTSGEECNQSSRPRLSVVVPCRNEEPQLASVVQAALSERGAEVIIAASGRWGESLDMAVRYGAQFRVADEGRGRQMNAGARLASGDALLFLHADSMLPAGFSREIMRRLEDPRVAGGAFTLSIDSPDRRFRLVEWGVALRSRALRLPYGDQGLFLRRETFQSLKGFAETPIMEDFEFMGRLSRHGKIAISPLPILTSARRWQSLGVLKTTGINQLVIAGYLCGISPERLARWYRGAEPGDNRRLLGVESNSPQPNDPPASRCPNRPYFEGSEQI